MIILHCVLNRNQIDSKSHLKVTIIFFYHNTSKSPINQKVESNLLIADFNLQALRIQSFFVTLRDFKMNVL